MHGGEMTYWPDGCRRNARGELTDGKMSIGEITVNRTEHSELMHLLDIEIIQ